MNYLTNYYKNLCEQLQEKVNILEAGLKQAIQSGDKEKMEKELARQKARKALKQEVAVKGLPPGMESYEELDPEVKKAGEPGFLQPALNQYAARESIRALSKNIEDIAMQLDFQHPHGKRRIKVSELPAESPFGTDKPTMHVTPQQY